MPMLPIHQITLPLPGGPGAVHVYAVRSDPVTLIDTGVNTPDARAALVDGLKRLGLRVRDVRRVLLTHAHVDHIGLAGWVQEESGAEVHLHPEEAGKAEVAPWWQEARDRILADAGVDPEGFALIERFWRLNRQLILPLQSWRQLADGQVFAFDGGRLEAVHLPGHALGHTGFLDREGRRLVGGDHLLDGITPNPILEPVPPGHPDAVPHAPDRALTLGQFLRSLDRAAGLDVDEVLPGHGPVITDHRAVGERYRAAHGRRLDSLLQRLQEGRSPWELTREVYPQVKGFDHFLALSEVLAHLDLLVVQGRALYTRKAGYGRYRAAI
ncbi:MBL fold metallo-hydrolase [Symbiobacterium thermophilum]|uniref:Metallo-beta-lactamase domain-containing protein n=2 Tax=Symbiobacterium thermophilum TaxID=2734 RepID=A0A953I7E4_SYMTR|nr:MBL fold metallo-hydrolase [Symbiobacterium thermophilum]MBY6275309.1 hypothetical protein [Symbiobacterium thermophilum]